MRPQSLGLGLRTFEARGTSIADVGEEQGHRVLQVHGKGGGVRAQIALAGGVVLVPLPPEVVRAIDRAVGECLSGPIPRNTIGARMDLHAATRQASPMPDSARAGAPNGTVHAIDLC